jgi:hypothetical protein
MQSWDDDEFCKAALNGRPLVVWVHDESVFYANDRRTERWVKSDKTAKPRAKGEGASLMVADFVSADYGWLRSPDGKESARVLFKPGKLRDGYFTSEDILKQANRAIDILQKYFQDEDHLLSYDNATTHLKRTEDALSARRLPKMIPKDGKNWGPSSVVAGPDRKPARVPDGKIMKRVVRMMDGQFNGMAQPLYFPPGHEHEGIFKGMR